MNILQLFYSIIGYKNNNCLNNIIDQVKKDNTKDKTKDNTKDNTKDKIKYYKNTKRTYAFTNYKNTNYKNTQHILKINNRNYSKNSRQ